MNKNYLFFIVLACISLTLFGSVRAMSIDGLHQTDEERTEIKTALGFLISDYEKPVGLYSFPVDNATELSIIKETNKVSAGAMTKLGYYAATYNADGPIAWCKVDMETGEMTELAALSGKMYTDMSYDYSSGTMYAISHPTSETTELLTINLDNGIKTKVADMDLQLMTVACSYDGELYSITANGALCWIDKNTGKVKNLVDLDFSLSYIQSMEFDHETKVLYWAACNDYNSALYAINIETLEKTRVSSLGDGGEMTGLYIPFKLAEPGAPEAVTDLKAEMVPGKDAVRLSWIFPSMTVSGEVLTSMTDVTVECDGVLLKKYVNGVDLSWAAGEKISVELEIPAGLHAFKVYVTNEAGNGLPVSIKNYIGEDIPAAPQNLKVIVDGDHATLTWDAVTTGQDGGNIDMASLVYKVVRFPEGVTVAENIRETTFTDQPDKMDVYAYEVVPSTQKGVGEKVRSEWQVIGEAYDLPFTCKFDDEIKFKLWTIQDHNADGITWNLSKNNEGDPVMEYRYSSENDADDWLFTPALRLKAGQAYKLKLACGVQNPRYPERLKVTMGLGKTAEEQTVVLASYELTEYGLNPQIIYLPGNLEEGNWYIAFQACSEKDMSTLYLSNVEVLENTSATFKGKVLSGETPLAGAKVTLSNSESEYVTDKEGGFYIQEIHPGTYTLSVSLFGYQLFTEEYTFDVLENKVGDIRMTMLPKADIYGCVKTDKGEVIPNAAVYVHGYDNYTTKTDKDGLYMLKDVYCKGDYTLEAYALNYEKVSVAIPAFTENVTVDDVLLREKLLSPAHLSADVTRTEVRLTWDKPEDKALQFRYDDGEAPLFVLNMQFDATENTVSGCIYDTPAMLTSVSWQVADNSNPKTTVDVIILDLDENGHPTNTVLFEQKGVPSTDSYWSSYQLPYPVVAPHGALIALKGDAHLCMDYGESAEWPFVEKRSCLNFDYTSKEFIYLEERGMKRNLLVRAEGLALGAPHSDLLKAPAPQPKYKVWRLAEEDETNVSNWTELTAEPIDATEYLDVAWKEVEKGTYKYAVKAVYTDNEYSYPVITEMIPRLMTGDVTLTLLTNAIGEGPEGATVTLINKDEVHSYTGVADEDGNVILYAVWEGTYTVVIEKKGFQPLSCELLVEGGKDISKEYTLLESTQAPYNLKIETNGVAGSRLLRWNIVQKWEDDFEGHNDFTINSPGELGWSYIDGDGAPTYASSSYEFPHMNEPMSFIVFNPSATSPSMLEEMTPHSGDKLLCCFACTGGVQNDDYIVSPELEMDDDFVIRFWASSYSSSYKEEIRIGYSTTGKEKDDFIWIGENQIVPAVWTEYIINIPKDAKFVTINCVSNDRYILMLDDIYIGAPQQVQISGSTKRIAGQPTSYEVYLDGEKVTSTTETSYTFENLSKGDHSAGVKNIYASGATEMSVITFNVEEGVGIREEAAGHGFVLYPLPVREVLNIEGIYDEAELVNSSGQVILRTDYTPVIQMGKYPAGMYYLILKKGTETVTLKVPVK